MSATVNTSSPIPCPITDLRLSLWRNGYTPIPVTGPDYRHKKVLSPGKQPFFKDWQNVGATIAEAMIVNWPATAKNHPNTGVLCGNLVAVDIDVLRPDLATALDALAEAMLGPTPLHRVGKAPKRLRCYRTDAPMRKMETAALLIDGEPAQIEIMGEGQQVVAYGIHPGTKKPYQWPGETPLTVPLSELPTIAEPSLRAFLAIAEGLLRGAGGRTRKELEQATADADKAARAPDPPPASKPHGKARKGKTDFFFQVNDRAVADAEPWFRAIFPAAWREEGTGAWRVSSADIGRGLEEDLSVHPINGGHDFGTGQSCTPIDIVMEHDGAATPIDAAIYLCDKLRIDPLTLGWKPSPKGDAASKSSPETEAVIAATVERFNALYMVVNEGGKAVILQPGHDPVLKRRFYYRLTPRDLHTLYMNDRIQVGVDEHDKPVMKSVSDVWLRHRDRRQFIQGVTFDPTEADPDPGVLNMWEGFAFRPVAGDWSLLRSHILSIICNSDPDRFNYLMGWMARMVQRPAEQGEVAVVMKGGEGTGKGTLARALKNMIGHHALAISNAKHLVGNFNAHLRDAVFLFADEAFFAGDRAHVGVLKSLITEPYLTIEAKFQNALETPNFLHLMMASNEEWVVPAALDSRRFFVLEVVDTCKDQHDYFAKIWAQMEAGGYAAMLHDLLAIDLTNFNVRAVPVTEGLQQQRKLSLPTAEGWWKDCLERGYVFRSRLGLEDYFGIWHEEVATELLFASYSEFADKRRERHPMSREAMGKFLHHVGFKPIRSRHAVIGEHIVDESLFGGMHRVAKVIKHPRPPGYSIGNIASARDAFTSATGLSIAWPDDGEEVNETNARP